MLVVIIRSLYRWSSSGARTRAFWLPGGLIFAALMVGLFGWEQFQRASANRSALAALKAPPASQIVATMPRCRPSAESAWSVDSLVRSVNQTAVQISAVSAPLELAPAGRGEIAQSAGVEMRSTYAGLKDWLNDLYMRHSDVAVIALELRRPVTVARDNSAPVLDISMRLQFASPVACGPGPLGAVR